MCVWFTESLLHSLSSADKINAQKVLLTLYINWLNMCNEFCTGNNMVMKLFSYNQLSSLLLLLPLRNLLHLFSRV